MLQDIKLEIDNIIREINESINEDKIYLFGSYAYRKPNADSHIDLCIVTTDNEILLRRVRKAISNVTTMPVDVIVYYKDEFVERAKLHCTMEHKIAFEEISIYEQ